MELKTELNPVKWTPDERQQFLDKGFRHRRDGELPCTAFTRPADYEHDLKRGELKFMPGWFNYSLHTVTIPDGSEVRECNFTQCAPGTPAITGRDLKFVDCNLTNCIVDPSWQLERCNTAQAWLVQVDDGNGGVREKRQYICAHSDELKDQKDMQPPVNAVLARDF